MMNNHRKEILTAIAIGLVFNIVLTIIKLSAGIFGNSQALISDGLNSFSDVFISLMLLMVLKLSTKKPDHDHPYGHEKYEGLGYFVLGIIFIVTSAYIFIVAIISMISFIADGSSPTTPHPLTIFVAGTALIIKLILYFYYKKVSTRYLTPTLKADAKNHLIDAFATTISLIGLLLTQLDFIIFDYIASIIIGLFILRLGIQILIESISYLVDQAPSDKEVKNISELIISIPGVKSIDDIKVRKHMTSKYVDVEIGVQSSLSLEEAHRIAEHVHHKVENSFPDVIHCMVHVNPYRA